MPKTDRRITGDSGERRTARYLCLRGYRILERNFTFGHKEIDIIAKRGRTVAFVEVKTRRKGSALAPRTAVTSIKQKNIISASKGYAMLHDIKGLNIRFDISEVTIGGGINYIKNAFSEN